MKLLLDRELDRLTDLKAAFVQASLIKLILTSLSLASVQIYLLIA